MSSFRKRVVKRPIPGTRTSPQTGQMITSSGNPSLDVILGGGLPIGSICLIEEDKFVTYSKVLAKYFMAEGVLSKQSIFLGSLDDTPKELIKKLPQHCTGTDENEENTEAAKNGLRIAWRYNDLPMVNSEQAPEKIGHNFNLMEFMDPELIQFAHTVTWSDDPLDNDIVVNKDEEEEDGWDLKDSANNFENENDAANAMDSSKEIELENSKKNATPNPALCLDDKQDAVEDKNAGSTETSASSSMPPPPSPLCKPPTEIQIFTNTKYFRLLKEVNNLLCDDKFHSGGFLVKRSLCRVCITSLGSPQWYDDNFGEDLVKFLTILRAAIRSSVSVCFITMPMHLVAKYICGTILLLSGFYLFSDTKRILLSRLLAATSEQLNDLPQPLFYYISMGLALAGLIAVLAAMMGFWASCLNTYCCLSFYFLTVVVLLLAESVVCLAITLWPHCLGISLDETKMVKALQGNYGVPGREQFTIAMDLAQAKFGCCAMNSDINYDTSMWKLQGYGQRDWVVPLTCCVLENPGDKQSYLDPKPVNETLCQSLEKKDYNQYRFTTPCLNFLDNWYREQYAIFLAASLIVAVMEFCVLLSITLSCTKISSKKLRVESFTERRKRAKSRQMLVENIYEPEVELRSVEETTRGAIHGVPSDISEDFKEVYIQPRDLYKQRFNTTFKPISSDYSVPQRSYLV